MKPASAAEWSLVFVSIGLLVGGAESLAARGDLLAGTYSEGVLAAFISRGSGVRRFPSIATRFRYAVAIQIVQLVCVVLCVAFSTARVWLLGVVLITHLVRMRCSPVGLGGSDQMTTVVLVGLVVFFSDPGSEVGHAGLIFVAAESCLAYFVSGFAKLMCPIWRSGRASAGILTTRSFGHRYAGPFVERHGNLARVADWGTISFEMLFSVGLLVGGTPLLAILVAGGLFHYGVAVLMGLNDFFWPFVSTYPALLYTSVLLVGHSAVF